MQDRVNGGFDDPEHEPHSDAEWEQALQELRQQVLVDLTARITDIEQELAERKRRLDEIEACLDQRGEDMDRFLALLGGVFESLFVGADRLRKTL